MSDPPSGATSRPKVVYLECEEFEADDALTEGQLLRSTFAEVGDWLYERHRDQILQHMRASSATDADLEASKIQIRFRLSNGRPIPHTRRVSTRLIQERR